MNNSVKLILIAILLLGGMWGERAVTFIKNNVPAILYNTDKTTIPDPDIAYQALTKPLREMEIDPKDASEIRDFFWQLSQIIRHEPELIKTTEQFRAFNVVAGGLNFAGLEMKDKYPDLGEAIDKIIMDAIGKEDVPLDGTKREALYTILHAIAWSMK
jgi:hypothetical protein